jgi:hypothetical protein
MRQVLAVLLILVCGVVEAEAQARQSGAGGRSLEELIVSLEKQEWEAVRQKDYKKFESFLAEDFYDVFPNGQAVTKTELMQNYIRGVELVEYSLSGFKVVVLNRDAAVLVYEARARGMENQRAAREGAEKGKEVTTHVAVTSAWARRGGRWLNVFYRENDLK